MRRFREYNYKRMEHDEIDAHANSAVWEIEMSNTGNAPSAKDQLRLYALQTAITDILDEQKLEQRADGKERTCPDRVDGSDLTRRAAEHLKHIYADVRGDKEGCDETTGRGPKCDIDFKAGRDGGATGLICGDCGSKVEIMPEGLLLEDGTEVCPDCNGEVKEKNPAIACTQQQCRSRGKMTCRQCCVQSFKANHYYQYAYQPKGSVSHEWKECTVEQWTDKKKGATSRRPLPIKKNAVAMKPIGEPTGGKDANWEKAEGAKGERE